jgi:predicted anti-sigma-YlaC factor YlaD
MKHLTEIELIEYINDSIGRSQKAVIQDHLVKCESCRNLFEQTKLIYDSLEDLTAPQVNDLRARVLQGVTAKPMWGWKYFAYNLVRVAAVIIIAALAGYFVAVIFAPAPQFDSVSTLKAQSEISFTEPARHIALAVAGEGR